MKHLEAKQLAGPPSSSLLRLECRCLKAGHSNAQAMRRDALESAACVTAASRLVRDLLFGRHPLHRGTVAPYVTGQNCCRLPPLPGLNRPCSVSCTRWLGQAPCSDCTARLGKRYPVSNASAPKLGVSFACRHPECPSSARPLCSLRAGDRSWRVSARVRPDATCCPIGGCSLAPP
ncbi:centrosomal protein of 83 kDa [Platysternon megacephalum]|uniref:Centrosomal protein of 83 kDa n=1 Tax=Platysternon megacephalum TaxID=55544 RepID=A0A4D9EEC8_9SAUR|nr:centrosomal protein of 83 kDa [Platysternon megacephalum]